LLVNYSDLIKIKIIIGFQIYGTADFSPAHALKSTFGIEELAQATL